MQTTALLVPEDTNITVARRACFSSFAVCGERSLCGQCTGDYFFLETTWCTRTCDVMDSQKLGHSPKADSIYPPLDRSFIGLDGPKHARSKDFCGFVKRTSRILLPPLLFSIDGQSKHHAKDDVLTIAPPPTPPQPRAVPKPTATTTTGGECIPTSPPKTTAPVVPSSTDVGEVRPGGR